MITALLLATGPLVEGGNRGSPQAPPDLTTVLLLGTPVILFLLIGAIVAYRRATTTPPEVLDAEVTASIVYRSGYAGLPLGIGFVVMYAWGLTAAVTESRDGALLGVLQLVAVVALVTGAVYVLAYYWVRLPDALLPPPQRGRGGQWNDLDGERSR